ncbi:MAG: cyclic nucleotide-binding domain-containing protein [Proteobacteria bacterium]|nr:cyclic nucleotide-binding domain-containing protein [Pseudomonadota bacterium]
MIQGQLRRFELFDQVDDAGVRVLERLFTTRRVRAGGAIIKEGKRGDELYLVLDGNVEVRKRKSASEWSVRRHLIDGQLFGVIALLGDGLRTATCTATDRTLLGVLSKADFEALRADEPAVYVRLMQVLAHQLAKDNRAVRDLLDGAMAHSPA